jgi:hypothetical protein
MQTIAAEIVVKDITTVEVALRGKLRQTEQLKVSMGMGWHVQAVLFNVCMHRLCSAARAGGSCWARFCLLCAKRTAHGPSSVAQIGKPSRVAHQSSLERKKGEATAPQTPSPPLPPTAPTATSSAAPQTALEAAVADTVSEVQECVALKASLEQRLAAVEQKSELNASRMQVRRACMSLLPSACMHGMCMHGQGC